MTIEDWNAYQLRHDREDPPDEQDDLDTTLEDDELEQDEKKPNVH